MKLLMNPGEIIRSIDNEPAEDELDTPNSERPLWKAAGGDKAKVLVAISEAEDS